MAHRGGGRCQGRRPLSPLPLRPLLLAATLLLLTPCHAQWAVIEALSGLPLGTAANAAVCAAVSPSPGEDTAALSARCTAAFDALAGTAPGPGRTPKPGGATPSSSSAYSDTSSGTQTWWSSTTTTTDVGDNRPSSDSSEGGYAAVVDVVEGWLLRLLSQGEAQLGEAVLRDVCDPGNDLSAPSCVDEVVAVTHAYTAARGAAQTSLFAPSACNPKTTGAAAAKGVDGTMQLLSATLCSRGSASSPVPGPTQPYCLISVGTALNTSGLLSLLAHQLAQPGATPLNATDVKRVCPALAATGCCATGLLTAMQRAAQLTCSPQATQLASAIGLVKVTCALAGFPLAPNPCDDLAAANSRVPPAPSSAQCATLRSLSQPPEAPLCALGPGDCPASGCDLYCSAAQVAVPYFDSSAAADAAAARGSPPPPSAAAAGSSPTALPRRRHRSGVGAAVAVTLLVVVVALCIGTAFLRRHARLGVMGSSLNALVRGQSGWRAGGGYQPPQVNGEGFELMIAEEEQGEGLLLPKGVSGA